MRRSTVLLIILTLLLLGGLAFRQQLLVLPDVRREAEAGRFDTRRAIARLRNILGSERPHAVDGAANDAVRARIVAELRALGLTPRITDDFACNGSAKARNVGCGRVRNIVATIGPAGPDHLLFVSHYDSTPVGPGAADDGIGVAVMLEVAAQLARRDLERPVSFLFGEGEEAGLLGARAFVDRDPLARDVTALINLEARGVEGPAIMFETSRPNAAAIDWFERSVARPVANSLSTDFYRLIPNSTDVRVFEERPFTILNFAIIGNETRYHAPGDTVAALDPRSVQHMGDQALALAADHASGLAPRRPNGTRIFADVAGRRLVALPMAAGFAGIGLLAVALLFLAARRRRGLWRASGAVLLALTGSAVLAFAAHALIGSLRPGEYWRAHPGAIGTAILLSAALATAAALLGPRRRADAGTLRLAFWLAFTLLGVGISTVAPGASIFFLLSPAIAVAAATIGGRFERPLAILAAMLLLLLWAPLVALVEMLLDYDNGWIFAPLFALMLFPAMIELRDPAKTVRPIAAMGVLGMATLASWIAVAALPAYANDRKQAFGIEYAMDASGGARWLVVNDGAPLPAAMSAAGCFSSGLVVPWSTRKRWETAAPPDLIRAPAATFLGQWRVPGGRAVSIRLIANGAEAVTLLAPPSARLRAVRVGGRTRQMGGMDDPAADARATDFSRHYSLRCQGRACNGLRVDLRLASREPIEWIVVGNRNGLPPQARALLAARPSYAAPQYTADAAIGVTKTRF